MYILHYIYIRSILIRGKSACLFFVFVFSVSNCDDYISLHMILQLKQFKRLYQEELNTLFISLNMILNGMFVFGRQLFIFHEGDFHTNVFFSQFYLNIYYLFGVFMRPFDGSVIPYLLRIIIHFHAFLSLISYIIADVSENRIYSLCTA